MKTTIDLPEDLLTQAKVVSRLIAVEGMAAKERKEHKRFLFLVFSAFFCGKH